MTHDKELVSYNQIIWLLRKKIACIKIIVNQLMNFKMDRYFTYIFLNLSST